MPGIALMDGVEAADGMTIGGVPGLLESGPDGGGGDDIGDGFGLLLLELDVVMVLVMAGVVVVTMFAMPVLLETTKLKGDDDLAISSWGSGSLSMAAKLWGISCGDTCFFKCGSSLSFSVNPMS
jgi:hypothetical protein